MSTPMVSPQPPGALPADFDPPKVKHLGRGTRNILRHMADVILPRNERINIDAHDAIVNYVDNFTLYLPPLLKLGFPLGVWVFQIAAVFLMGRPFTWLSLEDKERYIAGWARSSLWWRRDLLKGVKSVMLIGFYEIPEVHRIIGYDVTSWVEHVKARREASYGKDA